VEYAFATRPSVQLAFQDPRRSQRPSDHALLNPVRLNTWFGSVLG